MPLTIGVSTTPGSTRRTCSTSLSTSVRSASLRPMSANLVAQYPPSGVMPRRPASDATVTIEPPGRGDERFAVCDRATGVRQHDRQRGLYHEQCAVEIDAHHLIEIGGLDLCHR